MNETKPQPRVTARVCSLCGLDWKMHGKKPTTETCIELLLAEVRSLNAQLAVRPYSRHASGHGNPVAPPTPSRPRERRTRARRKPPHAPQAGTGTTTAPEPAVPPQRLTGPSTHRNGLTAWLTLALTTTTL